MSFSISVKVAMSDVSQIEPVNFSSDGSKAPSVYDITSNSPYG